MLLPLDKLSTVLYYMDICMEPISRRTGRRRARRQPSRRPEGLGLTHHVSRIKSLSPHNLTFSLPFPSNILKIRTNDRWRSTTCAKCPRKLSNSWLTLLPCRLSTGKPCPPTSANPLQRHPQIALFPRRFCAVFKGGISLLLVPQPLAKSHPATSAIPDRQGIHSDILYGYPYGAHIHASRPGGNPAVTYGHLR